MQRISPIALVALGLAACESPTTPSDAPEPGASVTTQATTFRVNSTADANDAAPGNGVCRTRAGTCTLRAAIQEANTLAGAQVITLPGGVYRLTLQEPPDGGIRGGDLNITGPVRITGAGAGRTIIDAGRRSYVGIFNIANTDGRVLAEQMTLRNAGDSDPFDGGDARGVVVEAGGTAVLLKVAIRNNTGGGVVNAGTLTLDQSIVDGNYMYGAGGGVYNRETGTLTVVRSTISRNGAHDAGGGVYNRGSLTMLNSTVSGNGVDDGNNGGIANSGTARLNSVTVTGNDFGGIINSGTGTVTLSNSIVAGNFHTYPDEGGFRDCDGSLTSQGYNLFGEGTASCTISGNTTGDLMGVDALLGPLQNNGGPTPTHALLAGSPARNAANPAAPGSGYPACPPLDQRLFSRSDARCDIGAFEVQ